MTLPRGKLCAKVPRGEFSVVRARALCGRPKNFSVGRIKKSPDRGRKKPEVRGFGGFSAAVVFAKAENHRRRRGRERSPKLAAAPGQNETSAAKNAKTSHRAKKALPHHAVKKQKDSGRRIRKSKRLSPPQQRIQKLRPPQQNLKGSGRCAQKPNPKKAAKNETKQKRKTGKIQQKQKRRKRNDEQTTKRANRIKR